MSDLKVNEVKTDTIKDQAGTTAMAIDSTGRVTTPARPAFAATGTNYTQGSGAAIIIPASETFDIGSNFNASTGVFTAPITGIYQFGFWGLSYPHAASDTNSLAYFKNDVQATTYMQFNGGSGTHALASGSFIFQLTATDTITLKYYRGAGTAKAYSSQWSMYGYLIG